MQNYQKAGYLQEDFRVFHLTDHEVFDVDYHYHDFHKILYLIKGELSYSIEGRTYEVRPGDIIFVGAGEVHKPILHQQEYERIIIYVSKDYLTRYESANDSLGLCFDNASGNNSHLLRIPDFKATRAGACLRELESSYQTSEYATLLYRQVLFLEFLIHLNRASLSISTSSSEDIRQNGKMAAIIDYINEHLTEELSIETLGNVFFMRRYYLMHTFKKETGYSIGNYISTKRLLLAKELIENGSSVTTACYKCGFRNYSTFLRAYKKQFQVAPSKEATISHPRYSLEVE